MPELLIENLAQKIFPLGSSGPNAHYSGTTPKSVLNKAVDLGLALTVFAWFLIDTLAQVPNCILKIQFPFDCNLPLQ